MRYNLSTMLVFVFTLAIIVVQLFFSHSLSHSLQSLSFLHEIEIRHMHG